MTKLLKYNNLTRFWLYSILVIIILVETLEIPFKCSQIKQVVAYMPVIQSFPNSLKS